MLNMRFDEIRNAIVQDWLELDDERRQTEEQAATFATRAIRRYGFDPGADPFNLIMRWLDPYIPKRAGMPPINPAARIVAGPRRRSA